MEKPVLTPACRTSINIKLDQSDKYQTLQAFLDLGSPVSFLRRDVISADLISPVVSNDQFVCWDE